VLGRRTPQGSFPEKIGRVVFSVDLGSSPGYSSSAQSYSEYPHYSFLEIPFALPRLALRHERFLPDALPLFFFWFQPLSHLLLTPLLTRVVSVRVFRFFLRLQVDPYSVGFFVASVSALFYETPPPFDRPSSA